MQTFNMYESGDIDNPKNIQKRPASRRKDPGNGFVNEMAEIIKEFDMSFLDDEEKPKFYLHNEGKDDTFPNNEEDPYGDIPP